MKTHLLEISDLSVEVTTSDGSLRILDGVNLAVPAGKIVGLVGESGCGKTMTARAILGLTDPPIRVASGEIYWEGKPILRQSRAAWRAFRGKKAALIPQQAGAALNPRANVGDQLARLARFHHGQTLDGARETARRRLREVMGAGADDLFDRYPHQLSGGQQQRIAIALALACNPQLLIADEPTSGLDTIAQPHLINLYADLARRHDLSVLLISHNMGVIARACDEVYVMYLGRVLEHGPKDEVFRVPHHPYTRTLLDSVLEARPGQAPLENVLRTPERVPTFRELPSGCRFRTRCPHPEETCSREDPRLGDGARSDPRLRDSSSRRVACFFPDFTPRAVGGSRNETQQEASFSASSSPIDP